MKKTAFITSERKDEKPILIVDRIGVIGELLLKQVTEEALVVFVSLKKPEYLENVVYIPFLKKIPTIPDNTYSHIFIIDDETNSTKNSLESFLKKAKTDNAELLFATHISKINETFLYDIVNYYQRAKIAIFGDVFCLDQNFDSKFTINKFIYQAQSTDRIEVLGDGTKISYPVFVEDVVSGIFESVFGQGSENRLFYLFPKSGVTDLSLSHMLQKTNPHLSVDFVKDKKTEQKNYVFPPSGVYLLGDNYELEEKVKKIKIAEGEKVQAYSIPIKSQKQKKNYALPMFWLIICLIFFLSLPLITTLVFSFAGLQSLKSAKTAIDKGNLLEAEKSVYFADTFFSISQKTFVVLLAEADLVSQQDKISVLEKNIEMGKNISSAGVYLLSAQKSLANAFTDNKNSISNFKDASNSLKSALVIFQKEKAQGNSFSALTQKIDPLINFVSNTIDVWPDLFGFNGKKIYLVLFQNNMELRPSGGFIGSYGLLTLDKGKIIDFTINDVYDADGQLTGHVEPPFAIRRYLQSVHWYLRDSNYDVEFANSAAAAAHFLELEKKQTVNGVIGVDLSFVRNILSAMGEVYVPEYNEKVNSENLFLLTESHAEKNFFPGSTQKKDFLRLLLKAMENNLNSKAKSSYLKIGQAVGDSITQKHLLFAFDTSSLQNLFTVNGWSSSLWDDRKQNKYTINDYLGISEANLGINKANYFIKRSVSEVVNIDDNGKITASVTVAYKNTNTNGLWPGGNYKNYLRFILPLGAQVTNIKIDGQAKDRIDAITNPQVYENKNFSSPSKLEVEKYDQNGKTVYGFLVNVSINALETISVEYILPNQVDVSSSVITYNNHVFKQPGTDEYPYDFSVTYPSSFRVVSTSDGVDNNGRVVYSGSLNSDKDILINLAKK